MKTARASPAVLTSRGNGRRTLWSRSPVRRRSLNPSRSTAVIVAWSAASRFPGEHASIGNERIRVVVVHVRHDVGGDVRQRIGRRALILVDGNPVHGREAADEIDIDQT
jgi:hypothetical protein